MRAGEGALWPSCSPAFSPAFLSILFLPHGGTWAVQASESLKRTEPRIPREGKGKPADSMPCPPSWQGPPLSQPRSGTGTLSSQCHHLSCMPHRWVSEKAASPADLWSGLPLGPLSRNIPALSSLAPQPCLPSHRATVKPVLVLLPVLGLSWLVGLLVHLSPAWAYAAVGLNSFQVPRSLTSGLGLWYT